MVIDAGHGGKDPGNLGTHRYNTQEKDIALAVALKLGTCIKGKIAGGGGALYAQDGCICGAKGAR
ncbi:MAG: N-acetylmuramoyl-L-alanine amidase [Owenweeksia sp.]|nr:N-acetylmuramoyl-L-alanine amidase [Owenweeksia sp.]